LRSINDIHARGKLPILVGGTGLYFSALLNGLAQLPSASPALREELQQRAAADGIAAMHGYLAQVDPPSAARIHPNDPQRILRALEIFEQSGRPMSEHLKAEMPAPLPFRVTRWVLAPADRELMHEALARRFNLMLERGLINEVSALRRRGDLDLAKPAMRAVGYRAVWRYLAGELNYDDMVDSAIAATRQLAKRQFTWFRRDAAAQWWDSATRDLPIKMLAALDNPTTFVENVDYTAHATR
jgi:tRNA dimethylallyltransferase